MQTRAVGRTGIQLSVVGFGTAQLQMLPERQAIETLVRGFELGVNWVHTAPDYGAIDHWIQKAIEVSGREIMVVSAAPAARKDLGPFFENTCHVYKKQRLALYGLPGIEDYAWLGEDVWRSGGMIEYLQDRKAEGRIGGIYCSTHGSAAEVERLIESGVFDAIMLAWNPLEFHQQSHPFERAKKGRDYEDLREYRQRIFPLAAERGVSLLIMKPFAGGLLCRGKALPPHDWFARDADPIDAADVLRLVLEQPGVCAVVPGSCSIDEAEQNARAGHEPLTLTADSRARIARAVTSMRSSLCSRCGKCETTCSRNLAIPALFRDAYIWTLRNETNQAHPTDTYFDLHPDEVLTCESCSDRTCLCPQGIDIPAALGQVHHRMHAMRATGQHPGPSSQFAARTIHGHHDVLVKTAEVPSRLATGATGIARFLLQNGGTERWMAAQHLTDPTSAVGIGVAFDGQVGSVVPLRNTVWPNEASPMAFEFQAPTTPGSHTLSFSLMPVHGPTNGQAMPQTVFHSGTVTIEGPISAPPPRPVHTFHIAQMVRAGLERWRGPADAPAPALPEYGVEYLEHSFPTRMKAGVAYGIRLTLANAGTRTWHALPGHATHVVVHVFMDDVLQSIMPLPTPAVHYGQEVSVYVPFRTHDDPGPHRIRVELVHQGVTPFSDQQVPPWTIDVDVVAAEQTESVRLAEIARKHNPWRYDPLTSISATRAGEPLPLFLSKGQGCRVWDVEGNEFLDYSMGWGTTILGYADERIQTAIRSMLGSGAVLPFPHPLEMDVSQMILEEFPSNDLVMFAKNGSDVCTIAARLARVNTRKKVILSCGFHGWQDFGLEYFEFEHCGIPFRDDRCLYKFQFNDRAGFLALYDRFKDDLAAVMIEPAGALIDDQTGLGGEADIEFLQLIGDAARRAKALLIFDEIITGFRYRSGSVQRATGVIPDLTCLGKALASGMPLSALVGPYRVMLENLHLTHFNATFRSELYSLAAAKAAIAIYRSEPVAEHIWRYGEALRQEIHRLCQQVGIAAACTGPPFRMQVVFRDADPLQRRMKRTLLMQELLRHRIITVSGMILPSYAHREDVWEQTISGFGRALDVVAHAARRGDIARYIELALL